MSEFENAQSDLYYGSTVEEIYENDPELSLDNALENTVTMDLLEDVLHDYWEGISADADEIEALSVSDDYKLYTVKVHALKSSSRIVGLMKLGDMAYELELAGHEVEGGNMDAVSIIREKTPAVLAKYRAYIKIFAPVFEGK